MSIMVGRLNCVTRTVCLALIGAVFMNSNAFATECTPKELVFVCKKITEAMFENCIKPKKRNIQVMGWAEYGPHLEKNGNGDLVEVPGEVRDKNGEIVEIRGGVALRSYLLFYGTPAVLKYKFYPKKKRLEYTIVKESLMPGVTPARVWQGFAGTIADARRDPKQC